MVSGSSVSSSGSTGAGSLASVMVTDRVASWVSPPVEVYLMVKVAVPAAAVGLAAAE